MVNIRAKGQRGEREIVNWVNDIYTEIHHTLGIPLPPKPIAQRRQNQSAVGGMDLDNTCSYAFEIKNQENLNLNTWWQQTIISAKETRKRPVLIYKDKRKWSVMLELNPWVHNPEEFEYYHNKAPIRAIITLDDFKDIFRAHATDFIITTGGYT